MEGEEDELEITEPDQVEGGGAGEVDGGEKEGKDDEKSDDREQRKETEDWLTDS